MSNQFTEVFDYIAGAPERERRRRAALPLWRRALLRVRDWMPGTLLVLVLLLPWLLGVGALVQCAWRWVAY